MNFILTLVVGTVCGLLFLKGKIPGGMMVGALVGTVLLNISTGFAFMPLAGRVVAQITAGAFIGSTVRKSDILRLPKLIRPVCILVGGMLALNLIMGAVIWTITSLDPLTAYCCAIPGGMSDIPIIAADMGADGAAVALFQFCRLVAGIGVFPLFIGLSTRGEVQPCRNADSAAKRPATDSDEKSAETASKTTRIVLRNAELTGRTVFTLLLALAFGLLGRILGIPVGALLFSLIATSVLNLTTGKALVPMPLKRLAQVLSGTYIGCTIGKETLKNLAPLLFPALILVAAYMINCFLLSFLIRKCSEMTKRESMLACSPAGANDVALIAVDMGVDNPDLTVLQVVRMIMSICLFPQIIHFIVN